MYTNLIDIDALLPPDTTVKWRGRKWIIPGDIETGKMLALDQALERLTRIKEAADPKAASIEAFDALAQIVQSILAVRQPDEAQGLTFGPRELGALAMGIWAAANGKLQQAEQRTEGDQGNAEAAVTP